MLFMLFVVKINPLIEAILALQKAVFYIAQYPILGIVHTLLPGRPVQSNTISASLGSTLPRGNRLHI